MNAAGWELVAWVWFGAFVAMAASFMLAEHDRRLWRDRALSRYDALKQVAGRLSNTVAEHQALLILLARNGIVVHTDHVDTDDLERAETPMDIGWGERP